ncbi:hypothetical protein POM88_012836 [Heracleum sosnowskyi]|uniref:Uncharacterized protein n=1 Tax=Heracleum sosnowskyi TaxID=360622 RepID=A0AAD8MXM1_9APIA|nr:hypothetical protein POM88_012836 [Heracleum sosnowskyi]
MSPYSAFACCLQNMIIRSFARDKGRNNVTVDDLVHEITLKGRGVRLSRMIYISSYSSWLSFTIRGWKVWEQETASNDYEFANEFEVDPLKSSESEEGGGLIAPQEAFNRIADVVQEAVKKMEMVEEEKLRMVNKA